MADSKEEAIRNSFQKAKEHVLALEREVLANREFIIRQNEQLQDQSKQIEGILGRIKVLEASKVHLAENEAQETEDFSDVKIEKEKENAPVKVVSPLKNEVSLGRNRVSLDGYSLAGYSLPHYSLNMQKFLEDLPMILRRLSKQEFMTFLTIYQQEDEGKQVTYDSVAEQLKITAGCVRTYISGLIKKGLPIVKAKYNNKIVILSIPTEIRGLNLKNKLVQTYYNLDPTQKRLGEHF